MRISYSRFATYQVCPQQYKLQYVDRVPVPTAPELIFGSAVHDALGFMYDPAHLQMPTVEEVAQAFVSAWQAREQQIPEEYRQPYFDQGTDMIRRHCQQHSQRKEGRYTAATEMFFSLPFNGEHTLVGRFDRVDVLPGNKLEVIDYKTTRRMPSQQSMEKNSQLAIYRMAAAQLYPGQQVTTTLLYLLHDFEMRISQPEEFLCETQSEIRHVVARIQAQEFEPDPGNHCDWCAYQAHCPLFRAPKVPPDLKIDVGALLKEYADLSEEEKRASERKAELRAEIEGYLDRCQTERAEEGGYVAERRKSKRLVGWDVARLRETLETLGLWESVTDVSSASVRSLLNSDMLSRAQKRAVESAAKYTESKILRVRPVAGATQAEGNEE